MTLYEINKLIEDALDGAIDPETGEVVDEELMAAYEELQLSRDEKVENIGCFIKNLEADAAAIKAEAKNLTARAKAAENKAEHLRSYMAFCLQGQKFQTPKVSVSFRKSKAAEVDPEALAFLPERFLRFKDPEPDKKAITDALKAGEEIDGCRLVERTSVIIK